VTEFIRTSSPGTGWCGIHGWHGMTSCPSCNTAVPQPLRPEPKLHREPTVTVTMTTEQVALTRIGQALENINETLGKIEAVLSDLLAP